MTLSNLHEALNMQSPNGAFTSYVHIGERELKDENSFVTALVLLNLLELSELIQNKKLFSAIARALDFIEKGKRRSEKDVKEAIDSILESNRL